MFFPGGTFWKDWKSTKIGIWFIWRDGAAAGGRGTEVPESEEDDGWGSGRDLETGRLLSIGGGATLQQTTSFKTSFMASRPYKTPCSNMEVSSLIWVRMSDMGVAATWRWRRRRVGVVGGDVGRVRRV